MFRKVLAAFISIVMLLMAGCSVQPNGEDAAKFLFPSEEEKHEGTWLTWPHKYAYKQTYYFGEEGIK